VITSNYGEAGAVVRFGGAFGLPHPVSVQNALYELGGPPEGTRVVLVVGYRLDAVRDLFGSCGVVAPLDNAVAVDNEEQGAPVAICRDPGKPWSAVIGVHCPVSTPALVAGDLPTDGRGRPAGSAAARSSER
jgi:hypothetical protein